MEELTALQNAVYLLKQTQAKLAAYEWAQAEPIAVVGMACRFPGGGDTPAAYWRLLRDGEDAIREVPSERWNIEEYYDPDATAPGKMNTRWGGFLERVSEFDAEFFGISPREAVRVDPQHRLVLEVAWEALEDAGMADAVKQTNAGVYIGTVGSDYALLQANNPTDMDVFSGTGISLSILANRLSYVLNLSGPSIAMDTACSSSLVTVHLACQSLRRRECDLALAGGVNLILTPAMTLCLTKAHMLAPDGRCKTFDASADGYVRGEGCGMLVLKRLSDALAAGDRILAVVRGSGVNHGGRTNGLSAPSGPAQEAVIRAALADARLSPQDIGYVEAHGTGTRLGDPIEIEALRSVLCGERSADRPLVVASVKTNIGHLESAAGIAGLIKLILVLRHGQIPPHLHLTTVNPLLRLDETPIVIPTSIRDWPRQNEPRRGAVSSFGFGGTNAHVIIEEAPAEKPVENPVERPRHVLALSARSPQALSELAARWADEQSAGPAVSLANLAYTANTGRAHFGHRLAVTAATLDEARGKLRSFAADPQASAAAQGEVQHERAPRVAFLFTGQGAQYAGMARTLYQTQPTFRKTLDRCGDVLRTLLDRPLLSLLEAESAPLLDQTGYTQPVMFALEYSLATLWRSWGIEPAAVLGHSVGEFAAACVAGVFSLEDGLRLISLRARLMQALPPGGLMAALFAGPDQVAAAVQAYADRVSIAALNGPANVVISGDEDAVREILAGFERQGIKAKTLTTSHAFHSPRMEPILDELRRAAESVACSAPAIDIIANLTGQAADAKTFADPAYWSRHARSPVRFADSMQVLADRGCEVFLEIGPSPVLVGMGQRCLPEGNLTWLASLRPGRDDWQTILESVAQLYVRGVTVDWQGFDRDYQRRRVEAPTYPFQRRRYWSETDGMESPGAMSAGRNGPLLHPLLGRRLWAPVSDYVFEAQLAANRPATLGDHKIQGVVIMPGAAYVEMALAAAAAARGKPWCLREVKLVEPLLLSKTPKTVQTVVATEGPTTASFRIVSLEQADRNAEPIFATHAVGRLEAPSEAPAETIDLAAARSGFTGEPFDAAWQTEALRKSGLEPGPTFFWSLRHWVHDGEALGDMRAIQESDHLEDYYVHPGMIDSGFQLLGATLPGAGSGIDAYVPMSIDRLQWYDRVTESSSYLAKLTSLESNMAVGDIRLVDPSGRTLMQAEGVHLRRVPRDWLSRLVAGPLPDWCHELAWVAQPLPAPEAESPAAAQSGGSPEVVPESAPMNATQPSGLSEAAPSAANVAPPPADEAKAAPAAASWLIFDSQDGSGAALAQRLQQQGDRCTLSPACGDAQSRRATVAAFLPAAAGARQGVICLSGVDIDGQSAPDLAAARDHGWGAALDVVHALTELGGGKPPRLWLVTRGAQAVGDRPLPLALAQAPLWGLGRVIAAEHPELACTRIDLDPQDRGHEADQLAEEIRRAQHEDQVAYRGSTRYVARLRRLRRAGAGALPLPKGQPYRLEITTRGQLDAVALRGVVRQPPGPGQVEIQVRATGLNFRDVLNVLDLYPGDPGPLGGECAGEIVAVGPGVEGLKPGDQVVGLAPASFASYALTLAEFVAVKPEHLSDEEAATIPICFLTAHLALRRLGNMQPGERVLIHAASGGVGLAAIQIAQQIGAEIFATAGSPRKREYLHSLGIRHVMDSRSTDFAAQIMEATGGEGVDLVVNSLTGETIGASLSTLRAGGRFLELGKTDLWDQKRVDEVRPGVTFHALALDRLMADQPQFVGELMREVLPQFAEKTLLPLPLRAFKMQRAVDALRHMARAEHIGKVVIQAAAESGLGDGTFALRDDGSYLITGGLGGLGLRAVRWLADRGARHVVLVGRSPAAPQVGEQLQAMEKAGVHVVVRQCDVSSKPAVAELLAQLAAEMPPLRGIFHLAGVLDDGVLREQTRERFDRVMAAKVLGAWNLHELTLHLPLDLFVLFSSAAALLGAPGQANYAAANAFLDALAHHRRWMKRPALSVNWGAWAEVGMAARLKDAQQQRLLAAGVGTIEPPRGLETLENLLIDQRVQAGVLPIAWAKFFLQIPPGSEPAWLSDMAREARAMSEGQGGPPVLRDKLLSVTPAERLETALNYIRQQAGRVLAMDDDNLPDPRRTLNEVGFDSLTAVEFCNRVSRSIGQHLNPTLLFDYPTLERLAGYIVCDVLKLEVAGQPAGEQPAEGQPAAGQPAEQAAAEATDEVRRQTLADVETMSEEEMNNLVTQQLEKLQK